jgi:tRNA A37 threonylcarbamoyladenosine synthetase subunit TsaC/SUA5/YrdC
LNVKNKTFGFRIPDHKIPTELINALGRPILSSSLKTVDEDSENRFYMYPEDIYSDYSLMVDMIIDGGSWITGTQHCDRLNRRRAYRHPRR